MVRKNKRKLKNFFIHYDLQMRMISSSLIYMLLVVLFMLGVVLFPIIQKMMNAEDPYVQYIASQTFLVLTQRMIPVFIIIFLLVLIHQVVLSHRICGPLMNFTNTFKKIGEGDLTRRIYIRHWDYLKKECRKINDMVDGISEFISRMRSNNVKLVSLLEDVKVYTENLDTKEEIDEMLLAVKQEAERLKEDLSFFKLPEEQPASKVTTSGKQ